MEPLPIPSESYWIDDHYYGYLGDELRFADRIFAEGRSLDEAVARLLADPACAGYAKLGPGKVRISLSVVGYRPMTDADASEHNWARQASAEREANRKIREREHLRETLEHYGIPTERRIFDTPTD